MIESIKHILGTNRILLLLAFTSMLCFAIAIGMVGLTENRSAHQKLEAVIGKISVKLALIKTMHSAIHERSLLLYKMATLEDRFLQDEAFLKYTQLAAEFSLSYNRLKEMDLSQSEKSLLEAQARAAETTVELQHQVVDLAWAGELHHAQQLLTNKAVLAQNKVMDELTKLQKIQHEAILQIEKMADRAHAHTRSMIFLFVGLALLLGGTITYLIIKRVTHIEKTLKLEKELAQITLHSIGDAVISTDKKGIIQFLNPVAEQLTGYKSAYAAGRALEEIFNIINESDHLPAENPISIALEQHIIFTALDNIILIRRDSTQFAIELTAAPIMDDHQEIYGAILIFRDVSEMRSLSYKLAYQATHDSLTGLVNRYEFEMRLEQAIQSTRKRKIKHALCYMDLDQFKIVNDSAGHAAGDELLKQLANKLSPLLRKTDVLARLGGDEFGVLLENCDESQAYIIAEAMRATIKETRFPWENNTYEVGVSIGLVPITSDSGNITDILSAADTACYTAKDNGRNQIQIYRKDNFKFNKHKNEMLWFQDINKALENNDFFLYCQDIVPLNQKKGLPRLCELLIRFKNKNGDIVPPMAFLPAAERYNLMQDIDRWVVHNAIETLADCQHSSAEKNIHLSVNLSGNSLSDSRFHDFVYNEIINSQCRPEHLCFEITETTAIANMSKAIRFIKSLKELGCKFALDDFGNGLSSFSYLKNMPVDYIKIDGSFVRDICHDRMDHAFIEAIHRIGKMMHISTIAEYVENEDILEQLRNIGVDYAQGYYFSKPVAITSRTGLFNDVIADSPKQSGVL